MTNALGATVGTTGQVMEFRVVPAVAADLSTPPQFLALPALLPPGSWDDGDPRLDPVPGLGEHTDALLAELGVDAATVAALRAAEAI